MKSPLRNNPLGKPVKTKEAELVGNAKDAYDSAINSPASDESTPLEHIITHDGFVHNPLGSGGYIWMKSFVSSLLQDHEPGSDIVLHTDPSSVLNTVFALSLAKRFAKDPFNITASVQFDRITCQKRPAHTDERHAASNASIVNAHLGMSTPFHFEDPGFGAQAGRVLHFLLVNSFRLNHCISISSVCSTPGCAKLCEATDYVMQTSTRQFGHKYADDVVAMPPELWFASLPGCLAQISFPCPNHGGFVRDLGDPTDCGTLQVDDITCLLLKVISYSGLPESSAPEAGISYSKQMDIHVLSASYSGTSYEQLLWAPLMRLKFKPPMIVYVPMIVDWAGSPSKIELGEGEVVGLQRLTDTVGSWLDDPKKLFRYWSTEFFNEFVFGLPDRVPVPGAPLKDHTYEVRHDGILHAGDSSPFKFISHLTACAKQIVIHIGAQPNNSPHAGTTTVFAMAFAAGKRIKEAKPDLAVNISLDFVDTAPDSSKTITLDNVTYQQSHRATEGMKKFLPDYHELVQKLSDYFGVQWGETYQKDLLSMDNIPGILHWILGNYLWISERLAPQRKKLCIRSRCSKPGCLWSDKHGIRTRILVRGKCINSPQDSSGWSPPTLEEAIKIKQADLDTVLEFHCPEHGVYTIDLTRKDEVGRLEFNTPLRNLVRTVAYGLDTVACRKADPNNHVLHVRFTGSDYSGMYQERLLWSVLMHLRVPIDPPMIVYAPLIVDWAGSKLSKSLYVKEGAYKYLEAKGMGYLLSCANMKAADKDPLVLAEMVDKLLDVDYGLERPYSIDYIHTFLFG
ncbi:hypothetical protein AN958_06878 [Leucoagaricus sp. SymC.cos]|nr:hypothetical protein AN958_06878 [Leucoagaricus sp. SymC.cos]